MTATASASASAASIRPAAGPKNRTWGVVRLQFTNTADLRLGPRPRPRRDLAHHPERILDHLLFRVSRGRCTAVGRRHPCGTSL